MIKAISFSQIILCRCPKIPDFARIFSIATRKIMVLLKYSLVAARKILIWPKFLRVEEEIAFLPSSSYGYGCFNCNCTAIIDVILLLWLKARQLASCNTM